MAFFFLAVLEMNQGLVLARETLHQTHVPSRPSTFLSFTFKHVAVIYCLLLISIPFYPYGTICPVKMFKFKVDTLQKKTAIWECV